jgi:cytoskeletal protein RodZ
MSKQKQAGFAFIEAVLIVAVLALLSGIGYWVVTKNKPAEQAANQTTSSTTPAVKTPTAEVEQSLNQAVEVESATEDTSAADIEKEIDSAADTASSVGDSFNENEL